MVGSVEYLLGGEIGISERELRICHAMLTENKNKVALFEEFDKKNIERIRKTGLQRRRGRGGRMSLQMYHNVIREFITLLSEERAEIIQAIKGLQKEIKNEKKGLIEVAEKFDKTEIRLTKKIRGILEGQLKEIERLHHTYAWPMDFPEYTIPLKKVINLIKKQIKQDKMLISFDVKLLRDFERQRKSKKFLATT